MLSQKDVENLLPLSFSKSNRTSSAQLLTSGLGSDVRSDKPANIGNQKCSVTSKVASVSTSMGFKSPPGMSP